MAARIFLIIGLFFIQCALAQDYERIEKLAGLFLQQTNVPGFSMAISKEGDVVYSKGFGLANVKASIPMDPTIQLRTASVAKVLTATAIGRLATEQKLNFDDPIGIHVPYIDVQYSNLTIRQLSGHTSGLKHRPNVTGYRNKQFAWMKETLPFITDPLLFEPGTDYQYSTNAFNLLGVIIEEVSGMSYEMYMRKHIFEPLEMRQTFAEDIKKTNPKNTELYFLKKGKLLKEKLTSASYKLPGAGFRSTPTDLVKLTNAYSNGMISEEVVAQMFQNNMLRNGKKTNVGITWRISTDVYGNQAIEHAGSWRGTRTVLVYYPKEQLSIALMINTDCNILIEETAHIFAQLFRAEKKSFTPDVLEEKITIIFNSQKGEERFGGSIQIQGEEGIFKGEADNFLAKNSLLKISNTAYAMATEFGLLYLEMDKHKSFGGKAYAYTNRTEINPKEKTPLVAFKIVE